MSSLGPIGLVIVLLAAATVAVLVVQRRTRLRRAAARGPRTVADLVRMRAEQSGASGSDASGSDAPAKREPAATTETPPVTESAPEQPAAAEPAPVPVPEQARAEPRPAPRPAVAPPAVPAQADRARENVPTPVVAAVEKSHRAPGPDAAGVDTPWHRAALMAAGDGGAGTWQPPAPAAPVVAAPAAEPGPLRLVPPVEDDGPITDPEPEPEPDPEPEDPATWTGWADWDEVDAEEAAEETARAARRSGPEEQSPERTREPDDPGSSHPGPAAQPASPKIPTAAEAAPAPVPTRDADPEVEPVARPLGKRTPEERAAEQAAADVSLLRTFGYTDPSVRPDTAPVVAMIRPDLAESATVDEGAAQPVRFHVVGRDGAPIESAAVALLDDSGLEVAKAAVDASGRGEVLAPAAGTFALVATARGHQPNVLAVSVVAEPVDVEAPLARSASVAGSVQGEDGPIAGARVTLVQDGEAVEVVTTDDDGGFHIADVTPGEYGLSVAAAGFVPVVGVVDVPDEADVRRDVFLDAASPQAESASDGYDDGFDGIDGMMSGQRFS